MKKLFYSLVLLIGLFIFMPLTEAKNDVKVYMFTKNGCPSCEVAFEYFDSLLKENPGMFELVNLEVWCGIDYTATPDPSWIPNSQAAVDFFVNVLDDFKVDTSEGVGTPTIVVGDYIQVGANDMDKFEDRIKEMQDSKKYVDKIEQIAKDNDVTISDLVKPRDSASCDIAAANSSNNEDKNLSKSNAIILVGVFVILVGGFAGLILVSRKN